MSQSRLYPSGNGRGHKIPSSGVDYTKSVRQAPIDPAYHPPFIGSTVSRILSGSFGCLFEPASIIDVHACTPLPIYIEGLLNATKLPFQVTVASLILLQRLYIRLPPEVFESRKHFSPHQLFTAAYMTAGKQYTQSRLGLDFKRSLACPTTRTGHGGPTLERDGVNVAILMSNDYWSKRTSYPVQDIRKMEKQLQDTLGGGVAMFPIKNTESGEFLKQIKSLPRQRPIPVLMSSEPQTKSFEVKNLGRMSFAEHMEYFRGVGETAHLSTPTTKKKA